MPNKKLRGMKRITMMRKSNQFKLTLERTQMINWQVNTLYCFLYNKAARKNWEFSLKI